MSVQPRQNHLILWIISIAVGVIFLTIKIIVPLLIDLFWFRELGLSSVFIKTLATKTLCFLIIGGGSGLLVFGNLLLAQHNAMKPYVTMSAPVSRFVQTYAILPLLKYLIPVVSLLVVLALGSMGINLWETVLKFRSATPFGSSDPLFGKDIGFYVFALPFYRSLYQGFAAVMAFSLVGSLFIYTVRQQCTIYGRTITIAPAAKVHILILLGLLVGTGYFFYQFKMYGLITTGSHIVNGAGYADVKYYLPFLKIMRFICPLAAILIFANIRIRTFGFALAGIAFIFLGDMLGKGTSQIVQKFIVAPNEVEKETPFILWSIKNTRAAYNLDKIEARHFTPSDNLTGEQVKNNNLTVNNIRLWEQAPLLTTYSQLQEIRTYYRFLDVDNDRYKIGGELRQVMLSPRELVPANLPSRIWINERLCYTHGYGLCLGPVNSVTQEGLPDFFIKNIPPESNISLKVTRPEIYYGEAQAGYAIVKTKAKEFDYPSGNDNVYSTYTGKGGIPIGGLFKKLLFVLNFQELKILLSTDITPESRIMYHRQIMERVTKAIPFLRYDSDPYLVITESGKFVWMLDGYTVTSAYPYSTSISSMGNYIRNSVKVTIDAYDGSIAYFIANPDDPIITTYANVFPGVFKPFSAMPSDLRSHIRYPQTLFAIQARVYSLYHMTDPQVFYNKEDMWKIPGNFSGDSLETMLPYYTIMKLAEVGKTEEFILMAPFTPAKKENMIAWLAARCDEPNYGKLLVFEFPKQTLVYGPQQIESRIHQDPEISKALALWNQGGSRVIWGSLLVIPIEQSLIYVQPLYIAAQSGGVPELKRVIVAYGNAIAMEATLEQSLDVIFGKPAELAYEVSATAGEGTIVKVQDIKSLVIEADRQYTAAQEELKKGNWSGYGASMEKVKRMIKELAKRVQ